MGAGRGGRTGKVRWFAELLPDRDRRRHWDLLLPRYIWEDANFNPTGSSCCHGVFDSHLSRSDGLLNGNRCHMTTDKTESQSGKSSLPVERASVDNLGVEASPPPPPEGQLTHQHQPLFPTRELPSHQPSSPSSRPSTRPPPPGQKQDSSYQAENPHPPTGNELLLKLSPCPVPCQRCMPPNNDTKRSIRW